MAQSVRDVMSRDVVCLSPDMNAKDALMLMMKTDKSGLPVIDPLGALVGVFTEKEVLKAVLPVYVKDVGAFVYGTDPKAELKKMASLERFSVKDLMRKDPPVVDEEASLSEASRLMLAKSERRVMVVKDKKVTGVITRHDVINALAAQAGIKC